ncbi:hypothetical protein TNCV_4657901 [Trichonephila clavipes]|nr:hypothetical protein TNCV_4657901 [Trichonephila clavipes]
MSGDDPETCHTIHLRILPRLLAQDFYLGKFGVTVVAKWQMSRTRNWSVTGSNPDVTADPPCRGGRYSKELSIPKAPEHVILDEESSDSDRSKDKEKTVCGEIKLLNQAVHLSLIY